MQMRSAGKGFRLVWVLVLSVLFTTVDSSARVQSPPTGKPTLSADALSTNMIGLKWTDVEGETQYRIERRRNGTPWVEIGANGGNSANWYDTNLQANTFYAYRVRGWNAAGYGEYSNEAAATTWAAPASAPPGVPRITYTQGYALTRDV